MVKPQPPAAARDVITYHHPDPRAHYWAFDGGSLLDWAVPCPYGEVGDRLYVRETWQHSNHPFGSYEADCTVFYRTDYLDDPLGPDLELSKDGIRRQWRPSIHMPRTASRILLEIVSVRVEQLTDCSEGNAVAEGLHVLPTSGRCVVSPGEQYASLADSDPRAVYADLWDRINGAGAWATNPWVWVVEFRLL